MDFASAMLIVAFAIGALLVPVLIVCVILICAGRVDDAKRKYIPFYRDAHLPQHRRTRWIMFGAFGLVAIWLLATTMVKLLTQEP